MSHLGLRSFDSGLVCQRRNKNVTVLKMHIHIHAFIWESLHKSARLSVVLDEPCQGPVAVCTSAARTRPLVSDAECSCGRRAEVLPSCV